MKKLSAIESLQEAKKLINNVMQGVQESVSVHIFPRHMIKAMATEEDPLEKIMEDREELITKGHDFFQQLHAIKEVVEVAEKDGNIEPIHIRHLQSYEEFRETYDKQLTELQEITDRMKKRLKRTMDALEKEIHGDNE